MKNIEFHTEKIRCPECDKLQVARVQHTVPFYTFIHTCEKCGYVIMESEWNDEIKPDFSDQGHRPESLKGSYKITFWCIVLFIAFIGALVIANHFGLLPEN